jgi:nitrogen fixation protein NifQ
MGGAACVDADRDFQARLTACAAAPKNPASLAAAGVLALLSRPDDHTIRVLPGLDGVQMRRLLARWFPGAAVAGFGLADDVPARAPSMDEFDDLVDLFNMHADVWMGSYEEANWVAVTLAAGCRGANHLWQDLRLPSRRELSALINQWFPTLAARNVNDMKWKKFFYKQLCEREEIFICRAPSCGVCSDYHVCFGPEE